MDRRTVDPRPGSSWDRNDIGLFDNVPRKQDRRRYVNPSAWRTMMTDLYSYRPRNRPESIRNWGVNPIEITTTA